MNFQYDNWPFGLKVAIVASITMLAIGVLILLTSDPSIAPLIPVTPNDLASWGGSLFSTFIGAFLAFKFGIRRRERERVTKEVVAGNLALFTLTEMWDRQLQFQRDMSAPYRGRPDAWLNLPIGSPLDSVDLSINRDELAFVLRADAKAWQQMVMEDRRFHLVKLLIEDRERIVLNEVWPRLVAGGVPLGGSVPLADVEMLLGPALVQQMRVKTEGIISMIDENVKSSFAAIAALRGALVKLHPHHTFINVQQAPVAPKSKASSDHARTENHDHAAANLARFLSRS